MCSQSLAARRGVSGFPRLQLAPSSKAPRCWYACKTKASVLLHRWYVIAMPQVQNATVEVTVKDCEVVTGPYRGKCVLPSKTGTVCTSNTTVVSGLTVTTYHTIGILSLPEYFSLHNGMMRVNDAHIFFLWCLHTTC